MNLGARVLVAPDLMSAGFSKKERERLGESVVMIQTRVQKACWFEDSVKSDTSERSFNPPTGVPAPARSQTPQSAGLIPAPHQPTGRA